jgi:hypothetical protein
VPEAGGAVVEPGNFGGGKVKCVNH